MALKSLNNFLALRRIVTGIRRAWLRTVVGVDIHPSVSLSLSSTLAPSKRGSISIGPETLVAFKTYLYTRNGKTGEDQPIRIGARCFIGGGSVITPGVTIGDECIVAAGAVVHEDVPSRCIVGGNPARILRREIEVGVFGRLAGADENTRRLWRDDPQP